MSAIFPSLYTTTPVVDDANGVSSAAGEESTGRTSGAGGLHMSGPLDECCEQQDVETTRIDCSPPTSSCSFSPRFPVAQTRQSGPLQQHDLNNVVVTQIKSAEAQTRSEVLQQHHLNNVVVTHIKKSEDTTSCTTTSTSSTALLRRPPPSCVDSTPIECCQPFLSALPDAILAKIPSSPIMNRRQSAFDAGGLFSSRPKWKNPDLVRARVRFLLQVRSLQHRLFFDCEEGGSSSSLGVVLGGPQHFGQHGGQELQEECNVFLGTGTPNTAGATASSSSSSASGSSCGATLSTLNARSSSSSTSPPRLGALPAELLHIGKNFCENTTGGGAATGTATNSTTPPTTGAGAGIVPLSTAHQHHPVELLPRLDEIYHQEFFADEGSLASIPGKLVTTAASSSSRTNAMHNLPATTADPQQDHFFLLSPKGYGWGTSSATTAPGTSTPRLYNNAILGGPGTSSAAVGVCIDKHNHCMSSSSTYAATTWSSGTSSGSRATTATLSVSSRTSSPRSKRTCSMRTNSFGSNLDELENSPTVQKWIEIESIEKQIFESDLLALILEFLLLPTSFIRLSKVSKSFQHYANLLIRGKMPAKNCIFTMDRTGFFVSDRNLNNLRDVWEKSKYAKMIGKNARLVKKIPEEEGRKIWEKQKRIYLAAALNSSSSSTTGCSSFTSCFSRDLLRKRRRRASSSFYEEEDFVSKNNKNPIAFPSGCGNSSGCSSCVVDVSDRSSAGKIGVEKIPVTASFAQRHGDQHADASAFFTRPSTSQSKDELQVEYNLVKDQEPHAQQEILADSRATSTSFPLCAPNQTTKPTTSYDAEEAEARKFYERIFDAETSTVDPKLLGKVLFQCEIQLNTTFIPVGRFQNHTWRQNVVFVLVDFTDLVLVLAPHQLTQVCSSSSGGGGQGSCAEMSNSSSSAGGSSSSSSSSASKSWVDQNFGRRAFVTVSDFYHSELDGKYW
ncbi:unnamed protein product [Amoebophrya sp. A120]|nr:unnamed protein product [Amoebophrya sp. A120]|eukprot:GSA120T00006982001.1